MQSMKVNRQEVVPLDEEEADVAAPPLSNTTESKSFKDKSMKSMKDIGSHVVSPGNSMLHRRQNILPLILI